MKRPKKDNGPASLKFSVKRIILKTERAVLVEINGREHWLPRSQVKITVSNLETRVEIPAWIVRKNGI